MPFSPKKLLILVGLLLLASGGQAQAREAGSLPTPVAREPGSQSLLPSKPRVNAPYFEGAVRYSEMAIFWFGQVTPSVNSVDVRVGYRQGYLEVDLAVMDRRLWYDPSHSPGDLTAWDSATLYIDTDGDTGSVPDAHSYRFDAQLTWWEDRAPYQAAYQGNGGGWSAASVQFVTWAGWRGNAPNDQIDDRGWTVGYYIPFSELGVSGPPPPGTVWGIGLAVHDRDDGGSAPLADQVWPPSLAPQQPVTWGQLLFGTPTYSAPPATPGGTVTIRHGLSGATVLDADVGGSSDCGSIPDADLFPIWGSLNYAGRQWLNIQNQGDVADWPCFSRYYVTFPLDALPPGATVLSATLVLHQFGNAGQGWDPGPQPSLIQVLTIGEDWDESTLNWNNAPLAQENVAAAWVYPMSDPPPAGDVPRQWDVSRAVAEAHAAGQPARLALYEADDAMHSGKYFRTSDIDQYEQENRPTLILTWGYSLVKTASPRAGGQGTPITYRIGFAGTGNVLTLTDTLPSGISSPSDLVVEGTTIVPTYDAPGHRLIWSDTPPAGQAVTIRYVATVTTSDRRTLVNTANLVDADGTRTASAKVLVNPEAIFLPSILR